MLEDKHNTCYDLLCSIHKEQIHLYQMIYQYTDNNKGECDIRKKSLLNAEHVTLMTVSWLSTGQRNLRMCNITMT